MDRTRGMLTATTRWVGALAVATVLVPTLAGCSLLQSPDTNAELSALATCALGHTWTTDLEEAATKISEELVKDQIPVTAVTADGSQTLEWSIEGRVVLTSDYTITITTAPAADQVITVTETHSGTATGAAYINGEVAIPRKWDGSGVNIDTVADNNGTTLEELPFPIPKSSFDDGVGLELTCNGDTLSIHPRGSSVTQIWKLSS